jgi:hypothetical protein
MGTYGGVERKFHGVLISTLNGSEWSVSRLESFAKKVTNYFPHSNLIILEKINNGTQLTGGFVGASVSQNVEANKESPAPTKN